MKEGEGRKYSIGPHYVAACRHPVPAACFVKDSLCISSSNYGGHGCWRCTALVHNLTSVLLLQAIEDLPAQCAWGGVGWGATCQAASQAERTDGKTHSGSLCQ